MILGDVPLGDSPLSSVPMYGRFGLRSIQTAEMKTAPRQTARVTAKPRYTASIQTAPES